MVGTKHSLSIKLIVAVLWTLFILIVTWLQIDNVNERIEINDLSNSKRTFLILNTSIGINFLFMIWALVLFKILEPKLRHSYFLPLDSEQNGKLYKFLGVHYFQSFLKIIRWAKAFKPTYSVERNLDSLEKWDSSTRVSEAAHIACFLLVLLSMIYTYLIGIFEFTMCLFIVGVILQIYPVMLQRYLRPRILQIKNLLTSRMGYLTNKSIKDAASGTHY